MAHACVNYEREVLCDQLYLKKNYTSASRIFLLKRMKIQFASVKFNVQARNRFEVRPIDKNTEL
jgi:hypothetical protein